MRKTKTDHQMTVCLVKSGLVVCSELEKRFLMSASALVLCRYKTTFIATWLPPASLLELSELSYANCMCLAAIFFL
jgi:hypothetical protein